MPDPALADVAQRSSAIGRYEDWPAWRRDRPTVDGDDVTRLTAAPLGVPLPGAGAPVVRRLDRWPADRVVLVRRLAVA